MDLKACRICLTANVRSYHLDSYQLKAYYEEILNVLLAEDDGLLPFICYQCGALLQKYHTFRKLCIKSRGVLQKIWTPHREIDVPLEAIIKSEQRKNNIQPSINIARNQDNSYYFHYNETDRNDSTLCRIKAEIDDSDMLANDDYKMEIDFVDINPIGGFHEVPVLKNEKIIEKLKKKKIPKEKKQKARKRKVSKRVGSKHKFDKTKWKIVILNHDEVLKDFYTSRESRTYKRSKYQCTDCLKGFSTNEILVRHKLQHTEAQGQYVCDICKRHYRIKKRLRHHISTHQTRYQCLRCPIVYCTMSQAIFHGRYHDGVQYSCKFCNAKFGKSTSYYSHLRLYHRSSHLCTLCGASFVSEAGLNQHMHLTHLKDAKTNLVTNKRNALDGETSEVERYCKKCNIKFETALAYEEHAQNSIMHEDENVQLFEEKNKPRLLKGGKQSWIISCEQCGIECLSYLGYRKHQLKVHNASRAKPRDICDICGVSLAPGCMTAHRNAHTRAKLYPCPVCGKVFYAAANLSRHRLTHRGNETYICDVCNKGYIRRSRLKLHIQACHLADGNVSLKTGP